MSGCDRVCQPRSATELASPLLCVTLRAAICRLRCCGCRVTFCRHPSGPAAAVETSASASHAATQPRHPPARQPRRPPGLVQSCLMQCRRSLSWLPACKPASGLLPLNKNFLSCSPHSHMAHRTCKDSMAACPPRRCGTASSLARVGIQWPVHSQGRISPIAASVATDGHGLAPLRLPRCIRLQMVHLVTQPYANASTGPQSSISPGSMFHANACITD